MDIIFGFCIGLLVYGVLRGDLKSKSKPLTMSGPIVCDKEKIGNRRGENDVSKD